MMSELRGTITLDEESMDELHDQIYNEIIHEIEEKGCYYAEAKKFMEKCSFKQYCNIIRNTIDIAFAKSIDGNETLYNDKEDRKLLNIINTLING